MVSIIYVHMHLSHVVMWFFDSGTTFVDVATTFVDVATTFVDVATTHVKNGTEDTTPIIAIGKVSQFNSNCSTVAFRSFFFCCSCWYPCACGGTCGSSGRVPCCDGTSS